MELLSLTVLTDSRVFMNSAEGSMFFNSSMVVRAVAMTNFFLSDDSVFIFFLLRKNSTNNNLFDFLQCHSSMWINVNIYYSNKSHIITNVS